MVQLEWTGKGVAPLWPTTAFDCAKPDVYASQNRLYHCDAVTVMASLIPEMAAQFQLIYMDPPFFTGKRFNLRDGSIAYSDTRSGGREEYLNLLHHSLLLSRQLLAPSGIMAVHVDYHASAWARLLLDEVFGESRFLNEIIWHYQSGGRATHHFSRKHDSIYLYAREKADLRPMEIGEKRGTTRRNHMKQETDDEGRVFFSIRTNGREYRYYEDELIAPNDVWSDIPHLQQKHPERNGFRTQKPLALLRRIITVATRPDDWVGDFFCGSGTTLAAAQETGRHWMGGDKGDVAIQITSSRLAEQFSLYVPCKTTGFVSK